MKKIVKHKKVWLTQEKISQGNTKLFAKLFTKSCSVHRYPRPGVGVPLVPAVRPDAAHRRHQPPDGGGVEGRPSPEPGRVPLHVEWS